MYSKNINNDKLAATKATKPFRDILKNISAVLL